MFVRGATFGFALLAILAASHGCGAAELAPKLEFAIEEKADRLIITEGGRPVAEYVFNDPIIKRPYFRNVHTPSGIQVTRNHPPVEGTDLADHPTFHPGIWWGFGDINGEDFWRNKGTIRHERFSRKMESEKTSVRIDEECVLMTAADETLGRVHFHATIGRQEFGYVYTLGAGFTSLKGRELTLGDQEEMGLGVRVATPLAEKNGGKVASSEGTTGAKAVWGTQAVWCDYSGTIDGRKIGVTSWNHLPSWGAKHASWWHVRDYGLMVANGFGKRANPEHPLINVKHGADRSFSYVIIVHDAANYDPATAISQMSIER